MIANLKKLKWAFLVLLALLALKELNKISYVPNETLKEEIRYKWHNYFELKKELLIESLESFLSNIKKGLNKISFSFNNSSSQKEEMKIYEDAWFIKAFNACLMLGLALIMIYKTVLNLIKGF